MHERPVVNASPLIYLARAQLIYLLQVAGERIVVPRAVSEEIRRRGNTDATVRALEDNLWIEEAEPVPMSDRVGELGTRARGVVRPFLGDPSPGSVAILDDLAGRRCAEFLELPLMGTLGLVLRAKRVGHVPAARPLLAKLRDAGMYLADRILEPALRLVDE